MATIPRDPDVLDDLHYSDGEEVQADEKVEFSVDGKYYEIDLTSANAQAFRDKIAPEIAVAKEVSAPGRGRGRGKSGTQTSVSRSERELTSRIRTWAQENNIDLNPQGRIPKAIRQQYFEQHPNDVR